MASFLAVVFYTHFGNRQLREHRVDPRTWNNIQRRQRTQIKCNLGWFPAVSQSITTYTTMVRPTLEFALTAWDPHKQRRTAAWKGTALSSKVCLQQFQRQDTPYRSILLDSLEWNSLEQRRLHDPQPTPDAVPDQQWVGQYWPHQLLPSSCRSQDKRNPATTTGAYQPSCPI